MILETATLAAGATLLHKFNSYYTRDIREIKNTWMECMHKFKNENGFTFNLARVERAQYGHILICGIPNGYSFENLEAYKPVLESCLKGKIKLEHQLNGGWIKITLYDKPLKVGNFELVETNNHSLYFGGTYEGHMVVDMYDFPQVVIAGINNSGKSFGLYTALTNLYAQHQDFNAYLAQPGKNDLYFFKDAPQTKYYAQSMEDSLKMYTEVYSILEERGETIRKVMRKGINDIKSYNKKMPTPIVPIYVCSDEFSLYMPESTDSKGEKLIKEQCLDLLKKTIKLGRAYGIYLLISLQKTTTDQMPNFLKTQANTKLCFRQTDKIASQNIINCNDAYNLPQGEFILQTDSTYHCKTPYITEDVIQRLVPRQKPSTQGIFIPYKEEFGVVQNDYRPRSRNNKSRTKVRNHG